MDPVVHFEIPADNLERAKEFYRKTFGWNIVPIPEMNYTMLHTTKTDSDGMVAAAGNINGGLTPRQRPIDRILITIEVKDVDASLKAVEKAGGKVLQGKLEVPGIGWSAYIQDPEGNPVGLMQSI